FPVVGANREVRTGAPAPRPPPRRQRIRAPCGRTDPFSSPVKNPVCTGVQRTSPPPVRPPGWSGPPSRDLSEGTTHKGECCAIEKCRGGRGCSSKTGLMALLKRSPTRHPNGSLPHSLNYIRMTRAKVKCIFRHRAKRRPARARRGGRAAEGGGRMGAHL